MGRTVLPLAGLIIAGDDGQRAALLPVSGQTRIEHQARMARAAGVGHVVVLVDQIPADLVVAFDRLRADGINIDIARDARDAADRIHPDERLLVFCPGVVTDRALAAFMTMADKDSLLVLPDSPDTAKYERIDAAERWAGIALLNGQLLRDTVAMLGDWTLAPTLLRTALQKGAARISVPDAALHGLVLDLDDARSFSTKLARAAGAGGGGVIRQVIAGPVARYIVPWLLGLGVPLDLVVILPLVLAGCGALLSAMGWIASGLFLLVLALLPASAAAIIAASSAREARPLALFEQIRGPAFWIAILLAGWSQYQAGQGWGTMVLALWAACGLALSRRAVRAVFHADNALIVLLLAALGGQPLIGMGLIIVASIANELVSRSDAK